MKKILALLMAAVFAIGTGLAEAAPRKATTHTVGAKAHKTQVSKGKKHHKAVAAKPGKKMVKKAPVRKVRH